MRSPKELTRAEIVRAADNFRWTRKGAKWTVIVDERELPARPLVLEAAGVPPNDPTNSHQAVEILRRLGFETRYARHQGETGIKEREEPSERNRARFLRWFRPLLGKYLNANGDAFPPTCQRMLTIIFTAARGRINEAGLRRHWILDRPCESAGSDSCEGRQRNSAAFFGKDLDQRNGAGGSP